MISSFLFRFTSIEDESKQEDHLFAEDLCNGRKSAIKSFLTRYSDHLYAIASKICTHTWSPDGWTYRTASGRTIRVNDDVADTYLWLLNIAQKRACYYRGDANASFKTFILTVLNSRFVYKDWVRWKTGVRGYVPNCVKELGSIHAEIFLLMRQSKSIDAILAKSNLEEHEVMEIREEIVCALSESKLLDLIQNPSLVSLDLLQEGEGAMSVADERVISPADQTLINEFRNFLENILDKLISTERRILQLYWGAGQSSKTIYETFMKIGYRDELAGLHISNHEEIYGAIDRIIRKCVEIGNRINEKKMNEYSIDVRKMKNVIRLYMSEWLLDPGDSFVDPRDSESRTKDEI